MTKLNSIISGILALAIAVLYYLHFSSSVGKSMTNTIPGLAKGNQKLVYVNIDSLLDNYSLYKKMKYDFERSQQAFEEEMAQKKSALEKEYSEVQQKAQAGQLTEMQMQQAEERLMKKQQEMMGYKQEVEEKLASTNQQMTQEIFSKIHGFLKKMNAETDYHFVFGYTKEGGILLANDSLDITAAVLQGLNEEAKE